MFVNVNFQDLVTLSISEANQSNSIETYPCYFLHRHELNLSEFLYDI